MKSQLGELIESLDHLEEKVRNRIIAEMLNTGEHLLYEIEDCDSPIEQLMAIELNKVWKRVEGRLIKIHGLSYKDCACVINPQYEIKVNDKRYRVDFLIATLAGKYRLDVAVECDGHEFHEKTKEQAARDRARDRAIQSQGIYVLRFTGSEIWANAGQCANEVYQTIINLLDNQK